MKTFVKLDNNYKSFNILNNYHIFSNQFNDGIYMKPINLFNWLTFFGLKAQDLDQSTILKKIGFMVKKGNLF